MPPENPTQPQLPAQTPSPHNRLKILFLTLGILIIAVSSYGYFSYFSTKMVSKSIVTFEQCAKAGNPIMESFPEQCRTKDGVHFINWRSTDLSCTQVVTSATNPANGETREFPTPCDVPSNWEKLNASEEQTDSLSTSSGQFSVPENWRTYMNEEYGFEFKYPSDWQVVDSSSTFVTIDQAIGDVNSNKRFTVSVVSAGNRVDLDEIYNSTLNGYPAFYNKVERSYTIENSKAQMNVVLGSEDENYYKEILSTFKFIN